IEPKSISHQVLQILAAATEPMGCGAIFAVATVPENSTQVAMAIKDHFDAARVTRTGEKGSFRYSITSAGAHFLKHLDSRKARAQHDLESELKGNQKPKKTTSLAALAESFSTQPKPPAAPNKTLGDIVNKRAAVSAPGTPKESPATTPATIPEPAITTAPADAPEAKPEPARPSRAPAAQLAGVDGDESMRLAALILAHWPGSISAMPHALHIAIGRAIAPIHW
ncbi:MAG: hypothetical protein ABI650_06535, partial [Dokdonella sp.]